MIQVNHEKIIVEIATVGTKDEVIETCVRNKLINEKPFISMEAETEESNEISMLKLGN